MEIPALRVQIIQTDLSRYIRKRYLEISGSIIILSINKEEFESFFKLLTFHRNKCTKPLCKENVLNGPEGLLIKHRYSPRAYSRDKPVT